MSKAFKTVIIFLSCLSLFATLSVSAQDSLAEQQLIEQLPLIKSSAQTGLSIDGESAPKWRNLVPLEIYNLVREGLFPFEAGRNLNFDWKIQEQSESAKLQDLETSAKYSLHSGLPFAQKELKFEQQAEGASSPQKLETGKKILWNQAALFWKYAYLEAKFKLHWLSGGQLTREANGQVVRVVPALAEAGHKSEQLFRELITFEQPSALAGYRWLTFRYKGQDPDLVWIHSNILGKVRQVTGSNRQDKIVDSLFSPEDLFGWSGKVADYSVEQISSQKVFVPITSNNSVPIIRAGNCLHWESSISNGTGWNYQSLKFPSAAGWVPTNIRFYPRKVWRIELRSTDPFSEQGREVLYIDQESYLTTYKIIYDLADKLSKIVVFIAAQGTTKDQKINHFVPDSLMILDKSSISANLVQFSQGRYCSALPEEIKLGDLQPARLALE